MRRASTGSSAVGDLHAQLRERAQVFDCLRYPLAPLPEVESGLHSRRRSVTRLKVSNRYSGDGGTCMSPALPLLLEGSPAGSSGRARRQRCRSSPCPCPGVHRAGCVHPRVPEPDRLGGTVRARRGLRRRPGGSPCRCGLPRPGAPRTDAPGLRPLAGTPRARRTRRRIRNHRSARVDGWWLATLLQLRPLSLDVHRETRALLETMAARTTSAR